MFRMLIRLKVLDHKVVEFEQLVSTLVANIHANEPEPKIYEVRRVVDQPRTYVYFIEFKDQAANDAYANALYHQNAAPAIMACLDGDPVYETLDSFY
ncbi:MAG: putative quinol monooxygenase [Pseudomonadales bacterium]